ncbi:MAG TPA: succinate dehydrogenase assembly factor 2 [Acetobacteraceae bacterium]|nr:succinate dehydrogenase assembly factor 2 [Acetobacteraceae bacterium]
MDETSPSSAQAPLPDVLDARRRRLLFRANHRGTHENDLLVGLYVQSRIASFTDAELDALEEVLELPDVELADWLTGRKPIPPEVDTPMLRAIQQAAQERAERRR